MRPISAERFVQILVKHREWEALAKFALRMAEIDRIHRENPGELVRRSIAEADAGACKPLSPGTIMGGRIPNPGPISPQRPR